VLPRYLKASREEKTKILDEYCVNTGDTLMGGRSRKEALIKMQSVIFG
jgi:hypothetical protein